MPASAADLPVYGTKNFTPDAATPSYLSRENGSPPIGSGDRAAVEIRCERYGRSRTRRAASASFIASKAVRSRQIGRGWQVVKTPCLCEIAYPRNAFGRKENQRGHPDRVQPQVGGADPDRAALGQPGKAKAAKSGKAAKHHAASRTPAKSVRTSLAKNN